MPTVDTYHAAALLGPKIVEFVRHESDCIANLAMLVAAHLIEIEMVEPVMRGSQEFWGLLHEMEVISALAKDFEAAAWERKMSIARFIYDCLQWGNQSVFRILMDANYIKKLTILAEGSRDKDTMKIFVDSCLYILDAAEKTGEKGVIMEMMINDGIADYIDPLREDELLSQEATRFFDIIDCPEETDGVM